jgi:hypothetical protein
MEKGLWLYSQKGLAGPLAALPMSCAGSHVCCTILKVWAARRGCHCSSAEGSTRQAADDRGASVGQRADVGEQRPTQNRQTDGNNETLGR